MTKDEFLEIVGKAYRKYSVNEDLPFDVHLDELRFSIAKVKEKEDRSKQIVKILGMQVSNNDKMLSLETVGSILAPYTTINNEGLQALKGLKDKKGD